MKILSLNLIVAFLVGTAGYFYVKYETHKINKLKKDLLTCKKEKEVLSSELRIINLYNSMTGKSLEKSYKGVINEEDNNTYIFDTTKY